MQVTKTSPSFKIHGGTKEPRITWHYIIVSRGEDDVKMGKNLKDVDNKT